MRILMIHPHDIYSSLEPWTSRIVNLALEFVSEGHEVKLIYSLRNPEQLQLARYRQELPFETIPLIRYSLTLIKKTAIIREYAAWADIVHFQKCFAWAALPAVTAAYRAHKPLHYDWDDWEYMIYAAGEGYGPIGWFIDRLEKKLPSYVDTVSVASKALGELCVRLGFPRDRIFDAPVGADLKKFNPNLDGSSIRKKFGIQGPLIMYMGQLSSAQYVELFLLAAQQIVAHRRDVHFMVVGGGDRCNDLMKIASELNLNGRMHFTNAVSRDLTPYYLAAADVAVACFKDNEQQRTKSPLKIAEYMAAGKAIVATSVGEVPVMIGDAGMQVRPDDLQDLVRAIELLIDDANLRKKLGAAARLRAESCYNWKVTATSLLHAYETAMSLYA